MRACGLITGLSLAVAVSSNPTTSSKTGSHIFSLPADGKTCIYRFPNGQCMSDQVLSPYSLPDLVSPESAVIDTNVAKPFASPSDLLTLATQALRQNSHDMQTHMNMFRNRLTDLADSDGSINGQSLDPNELYALIIQLEHFHDVQTKRMQDLVMGIAMSSPAGDNGISAKQLEKIDAHVQALDTNMDDKLEKYVTSTSNAFASFLDIAPEDMSVSKDGKYIHLKLHNKTENAASSLLSTGTSTFSTIAIVAALSGAMALLL